jgi:predicted nucleotidyltransferase
MEYSTNNIYIQMLNLLKETLRQIAPQDIKSVFVYGSVSRFEAIKNISDLDVMVILKKNTLTDKLINELRNINQIIHSKYDIHMVFRIRNIDDLKQLSSGYSDFGLSSQLNYLRDAWYIYGEDIDKNIFQNFSPITEMNAHNNLLIRLSELRKKTRALVSIDPQQTSIGNMSSSEVIPINYYIGDILLEFSTIVCYWIGEGFNNYDDAISKSFEYCNYKTINLAKEIRLNKNYVTAYEEIKRLDEMIGSFFYRKDCKFHKLLNNLDYRERVISIPPQKNIFSIKKLLAKRNKNLLRTKTLTKNCVADIYLAKFNGVQLDKYKIYLESK